jgi:hypothetical protein
MSFIKGRVFLIYIGIFILTFSAKHKSLKMLSIKKMGQ